jgi:hypothetical protein
VTAALCVVAPANRQESVRRVRLGWCLLVVVSAHAVLLAMPSRQAVAAAPAPREAQALRVRMLSVPPTAERGRAESTQNPRQRAAAVEAVSLAAPLRGHTPVAEPLSSEGFAVMAARGSEAEYLPRSALSVPPRTQAPVQIDYPYFDGEADHYTGEFDLFINDTGGVVRVTVATPDLPGILGNAVREAFLPSRFSPGEVDGRPVRSRVRIEVTFDSRRLPSS